MESAAYQMRKEERIRRKRESIFDDRGTERTFIVVNVWVDGAALPSFPSLFISFLCALHLSMQWQQICQNICGCYGDGYKELIWSWLLRER